MLTNTKTDERPWSPRSQWEVVPYDEPVAEYRWLSELLDEVPTPWWKRLWRWVDPRKQFRDWDRDEKARAARSRNHGKLHTDFYR